jgi:soluble lytic murein transglycosylase-like protein
MQLMPETALELGVSDPFDPKESLSGGAKFLKQLMDKYKGDLSKALGAYNAGPKAVDLAGGIPDIQETKDYVDAILKKLGITRTVPPSDPTPKPTGN